jgi:hypothetical protein
VPVVDQRVGAPAVAVAEQGPGIIGADRALLLIAQGPIHPEARVQVGVGGGADSLAGEVVAVVTLEQERVPPDLVAWKGVLLDPRDERVGPGPEAEAAGAVEAPVGADQPPEVAPEGRVVGGGAQDAAQIEAGAGARTRPPRERRPEDDPQALDAVVGLRGGEPQRGGDAARLEGPLRRRERADGPAAFPDAEGAVRLAGHRCRVPVDPRLPFVQRAGADGEPAPRHQDGATHHAARQQHQVAVDHREGAANLPGHPQRAAKARDGPLEARATREREAAGQADGGAVVPGGEQLLQHLGGEAGDPRVGPRHVGVDHDDAVLRRRPARREQEDAGQTEDPPGRARRHRSSTTGSARAVSPSRFIRR